MQLKKKKMDFLNLKKIWERERERTVSVYMMVMILIILMLNLVNSIIFISMASISSGIRGFSLTVLGTLIILAVIYFIILKVGLYKQGYLLFFLLFATTFLNMEVQESTSYCADPTEPFYSIKLNLNDENVFYDIPSLWRFLYIQLGLNPCGIPSEFFMVDDMIRNYRVE